MLGSEDGDAISDLHHMLATLQPKLPGSRIIPGRFMTTELQIAYGKGKPAAAAYVAAFIAEMEATGFLREAITRAGLRGARVPD